MTNTIVNAVPVIGIGASAGGLEALEHFFKNCPSDSGAAFVVIQHLSTDYKSMMDDLLSRYTKMPVRMVSEKLEVEPDCVFLIPAGTTIEIENGRFHVFQKPANVLSLPIDIFFQALARHYGQLAVGVVLSGTGSDGTRGAMDINAAGGLVIAQKPDDARFDGMPTSLIQTGTVDAILPASEIPARIVQHLTHPIPDEQRLSQNNVIKNNLNVKDAFQQILDTLLDTTGIDFHEYKPGTVGRRIERRMQVKHILAISEYCDLLRDDPVECLALKKEILIPVTSFFRDSAIYDVVAKEAVTNLVANANAHEGIRVWVAACSTGEEAYSLAMLFLEAFDEQKKWVPIKLFATDVNSDNIDFAAQGKYPPSIAAEVSHERLMRFFEKTEDGFQVRPELRQTTVFARHNLLADAPFTRMHLVSCRNTLIYFKADAQNRILQKLRYATRTHGFLLLGSSETISDDLGEFSIIDAKSKLFRRTKNPDISDLRSNFSQPSNVQLHGRQAQKIRQSSLESQLLEASHSLLLDTFAPAAVLINQHNEIVHVFGDIKPFWDVKPGSASLSLHRVIPESLQPIVSAVLFRAKKNHQREIAESTSIAGHRTVSVSAIPLHNQAEPYFLVCFELLEAKNKKVLSSADIDQESLNRIRQLEVELQATRESLQATIEELETSNEELQATNEELMASNEELQSSNEELQSVNEELNTVNAEYHEKMSILNHINADLDGMSRASGIATVFVNKDMRLTRFTPDAVKVFKVRDSDIGRPFDEIVNTLEYASLTDDMHLTMATGRVLEKETLTIEGHEILVRMLPYSFSTTGSHGVVASFIDITGTKKSERLQSIINALPEHIAVLDDNGTIVLVNSAWNKFARLNGDVSLVKTGVGQSYLEACKADHLPGDYDALNVEQGIKDVMAGVSGQFSYQYPCHSPTEKRWFVMYVVPVQHPQYNVLVSHFNITHWVNDALA